MSRVLVIAPHPDDETLGCGGTLLKHKEAGDDIYWMIVTAVPDSSTRDMQVYIVDDNYGFSNVFDFRHQPGQLSSADIPQIISDVNNVYTRIKPNTIYLPFHSDIHSDHRIVFQAAYSCSKSFRFSSITRILMMEIISETEFALPTPTHAFTPNVFVDISDYIDEKIKIMSMYTSEVGEFPFPRSEENIRALSMFRGATAGCNHAEAFMLLKEIR